MIELIYYDIFHKAFRQNLIFSKEYYSHFLLSLKSSERFSLAPGKKCGNNKSLSSKYELSEPDLITSLPECHSNKTLPQGNSQINLPCTNFF